MNSCIIKEKLMKKKSIIERKQSLEGKKQGERHAEESC